MHGQPLALAGRRVLFVVGTGLLAALSTLPAAARSEPIETGWPSHRAEGCLAEEAIPLSVPARPLAQIPGEGAGRRDLAAETAAAAAAAAHDGVLGLTFGGVLSYGRADGVPFGGEETAHRIAAAEDRE